MKNVRTPPVRAADDDLSPLIEAKDLRRRAEERFGPKQGDAPDKKNKADRLRYKLALLVQLAEATPQGLAHVRSRSFLPFALIVLGVVALAALIFNAELPRVEIGTQVAAPDFLQGLDALASLCILVVSAMIGALRLRDHMALSKLRTAIWPVRDLADRLYFLQLNKDPERILRDNSVGLNTEHSPKLGLTMFELHRYLSYVRSALAILSWIASQYSAAAATDEGADLAGDLASHIRDLKEEVDKKWVRVDTILRATQTAVKSA